MHTIFVLIKISKTFLNYLMTFSLILSGTLYITNVILYERIRKMKPLLNRHHNLLADEVIKDLFLSIERNQLSIVQTFLKQKFNMNRIYKYKDPYDLPVRYVEKIPLHEAVRLGKYSIVKLLLDSGVAIDISNSTDETTILVAHRYSQYSIMQLLIQYGANVNYRQRGNLSLLNLLIQKQSNHDLYKKEAKILMLGGAIFDRSAIVETEANKDFCVFLQDFIENFYLEIGKIIKETQAKDIQLFLTKWFQLSARFIWYKRVWYIDQKFPDNESVEVMAKRLFVLRRLHPLSYKKPVGGFLTYLETIPNLSIPDSKSVSGLAKQFWLNLVQHQSVLEAKELNRLAENMQKLPHEIRDHIMQMLYASVLPPGLKPSTNFQVTKHLYATLSPYSACPFQKIYQQVNDIKSSALFRP